MMINRRMFAGALTAWAATIGIKESSKADGILTVSNRGQIVSTGDVNVSQAAGGVQTVYDSHGTAIGVTSNDLQIVSTGNVNASQAASGSQTVFGSDGRDTSGSTCTPGEFYQDAGCLVFCSRLCEWTQYCCAKTQRGKCCK